MAQQNQVARRAIEILDGYTYLGVTGLTISALSVTLERESSGTLVAATETVTLAEIGGGLYWLEFTPENVGLYRLTYVATDTDAHVVNPKDGFQVEVLSSAGAAGPYLCTLADVKEALDIDVAVHDDLLNTLIRDVTALAETYCRRPLIYNASVTEFGDGRNHGVYQVRRWPIETVASVHTSTDLPRVYGTDELWVADEDYIVEESSGRIVSTNGSFPRGPKTVQVIYAGGYNPVPEDLKRAAIEIIAVKWQKGIHKHYHITSTGGNEASITGIRFDDIPHQAREILELYSERGL